MLLLFELRYHFRRWSHPFYLIHCDLIWRCSALLLIKKYKSIREISPHFIWDIHVQCIMFTLPGWNNSCWSGLFKIKNRTISTIVPAQHKKAALSNPAWKDHHVCKDHFPLAKGCFCHWNQKQPGWKREMPERPLFLRIKGNLSRHILYFVPSIIFFL